MLAGGTSLIPGVPERLSLELGRWHAHASTARTPRPSQRRRTPELGCVIGGVVGGYVLQFLDRKLVLADVFQQIRGQQQIVDMIGAQVTRDARIKQHIVVTGTFIAQHGGEGKEDFGNASLGIGDLGKGDLPLPLQGGDQAVKFGVAAGPETIGQQRKRLFISP